MGLYKYLREAWNNQDSDVQKKRILQWSREPVTIRIEYPTRLDRARSFGYRAKPGFILVRQRVDRGGRQRPTIRKGRKPRHRSRRKDLSISYQVVAEQRSQKKFVNCTVLNSYFVAKSGSAYYYEVILVDRAHPQIVSDDRINWICDQRGRAIRGLTSAGRKSRALRGKGKGFEKSRPSRKANYRKD